MIIQFRIDMTDSDSIILAGRNIPWLADSAVSQGSQTCKVELEIGGGFCIMCDLFIYACIYELHSGKTLNFA